MSSRVFKIGCIPIHFISFSTMNTCRVFPRLSQRLVHPCMRKTSAAPFSISARLFQNPPNPASLQPQPSAIIEPQTHFGFRDVPESQKEEMGNAIYVAVNLGNWLKRKNLLEPRLIKASLKKRYSFSRAGLCECGFEIRRNERFHERRRSSSLEGPLHPVHGTRAGHKTPRRRRRDR